ncbi:hypothetical protein M422DRAFT_37152 [Sphaerobolus stellatus SS14]|uniref:Uncharacterized protein n=1 Tax=Sphaerobolus stellatus (strain SS14) TaxID=990650 RepID=A0A0C9U433_SPHS4|nr:hypothetical protein M422DRAFT_37152 [Sphaerobolus stellatus SS14]
MEDVKIPIALRPENHDRAPELEFVCSVWLLLLFCRAATPVNQRMMYRVRSTRSYYYDRGKNTTHDGQLQYTFMSPIAISIPARRAAFSFCART